VVLSTQREEARIDILWDGRQLNVGCHAMLTTPWA
jgi:hypothetical protein